MCLSQISIVSVERSLYWPYSNPQNPITLAVAAVLDLKPSLNAEDFTTLHTTESDQRQFQISSSKMASTTNCPWGKAYADKTKSGSRQDR